MNIKESKAVYTFIGEISMIHESLQREHQANISYNNREFLIKVLTKYLQDIKNQLHEQLS